VAVTPRPMKIERQIEVGRRLAIIEDRSVEHGPETLVPMAPVAFDVLSFSFESRCIAGSPTLAVVGEDVEVSAVAAGAAVKLMLGLDGFLGRRAVRIALIQS
jgi:hypothetical protein